MSYGGERSSNQGGDRGNERADRADYERWREYGEQHGWIKQNTGLGPKSYRRSDEAIEDEIYDALTHNRDVDATDIELEVHDGDVTLKGFIDNKFEKRLAEMVVEQVAGVNNVFNMLRYKQFGFQSRQEDIADSKTATPDAGKTAQDANQREAGSQQEKQQQQRKPS